MNKPCTWTPDNSNPETAFNTKCGNFFMFTLGTLKENKIKYCSFCGGEIVEKKNKKFKR